MGVGRLWASGRVLARSIACRPSPSLPLPAPVPRRRRTGNATHPARARSCRRPQAERVWSMSAHAEGIWDLALLPEGDAPPDGAPAAGCRAVTCSSDGSLRVWSLPAAGGATLAGERGRTGGRGRSLGSLGLSVGALAIGMGRAWIQAPRPRLDGAAPCWNASETAGAITVGAGDGLSAGEDPLASGPSTLLRCLRVGAGGRHVAVGDEAGNLGVRLWARCKRARPQCARTRTSGHLPEPCRCVCPSHALLGSPLSYHADLRSVNPPPHSAARGPRRPPSLPGLCAVGWRPRRQCAAGVGGPGRLGARV
jgi:hypothetical protein